MAPRSKAKSVPEPFSPFTGGRLISGPQVAVALFLVVVGVVPLFGILWFLRGLPFQLDTFVALTLLGTLVFAVIETFAIWILWGMKRLDLPPKSAHWLGIATVGEVGTLVAIIVERLFR